MNLPASSSSFSVSLAFLLLASLSIAFGAETSLWKADDARTSGPGLVWADSKGTFDFEIADAIGITKGEKSKGSEDAKSLVFSGDQVLAFRTVRPVPIPFDGFKLNARVNVSDLSADTDTTLLRHGTSWEIRYLTKRSAFLFIVWQAADQTSEIWVPAQPGDWQEIKAEFLPDKMTISVGGEKAEGVPKGAMFEGQGAQSLLLGASAPRAVDGVLARPFRGSISEVKIDWE